MPTIGTSQPTPPTGPANTPTVTAVSSRTPATPQGIQLLKDWEQASVEAAAEQAAFQELAPEIAQAIQDATAQAGRELSGWEAYVVAHNVAAPIIPRHLAVLDATPQRRKQTITDLIRSETPRVRGLRDPFMPIALNDPQARAKERVLWENKDLMVIVDLFHPSPKALVVPKRPFSFPTQASGAQLDNLAQVAETASKVFEDVAGAAPSKVFIHPPTNLQVKQMHVHVQPSGLAHWLPPGANPQAPEPLSVTQAKNRLYGAISAKLAQRLGPPVNP
ncbi:MAG: hypothetical protein ACT4TC_13345 [Myxococcaceae bacterium]